MPQEVQTSVGLQTETTLETIQAIGTSSVKIREGRQTVARYTSGCKAQGSCSWHYSDQGSRQGPEVQSTNVTILENYGKAQYTVFDNGVRVPFAGTYSIILDRGAGSSTQKGTIYIRVRGDTIYTQTFNSDKQEVVTLYADLGKFDTIEIRGSFYYTGSANGAMCAFTRGAYLTIQQL